MVVSSKRSVLKDYSCHHRASMRIANSGTYKLKQLTRTEKHSQQLCSACHNAEVPLLLLDGTHTPKIDIPELP